MARLVAFHTGIRATDHLDVMLWCVVQAPESSLMIRLVANMSCNWFNQEDREATLEGVLSMCEDLIETGAD